MNYNLIAQLVLLGSTIGLGQIIFSKISVLSSLPNKINIEIDKKEVLVKIKDGIKETNPLKHVKYEDFLWQFLKKIRILFLKADNKIFGWSQKLKENSQKKEIKEDTGYWDRIKRGIDK